MASVTTEFDLRSGFGLGTGLGEYTFADAGNLEHCIKYLNQTLVTFGFPASLDLFANDPVSIARTCNCVYSLVQQRQRDIEFRESSNEQRQRLVSDMSRLETKVERLDAQLIAKDRNWPQSLERKLKQQQLLRPRLKSCNRNEMNFKNGYRKSASADSTNTRDEEKEKEYIKLQEKLNQVLMEKKKESKSGMEIVNLLQKEGRPRGTWNGKKADSDFYKMIVDAYEVKKQELMAENEQLRALLRSMQMDMRDFLNAPNGLAKQTTAVNERPDADPPQSPLGGKKDVFDLPLHMARDQIEESLRTKMTSIKERMVQLQDAQKEAEVTSEASERELELEAQLVEARSIIQEQASIMSKQLAKSERPRRGDIRLDSNRGSILSSPSELKCSYVSIVVLKLFSRDSRIFKCIKVDPMPVFYNPKVGYTAQPEK
ncbi:hypothetical protein GIB67_023334 [Kingdonia uniflora]|uniref:Afadin-and alpha-actinin-binding protein n=1 Tax=Kingdonia uniflora TaxID=39325 RepID=A0A7J7LID6_9MAGN|nr:hypothetical protein GIB67_023334 [Kingdonia uniflora]